MSAFVEGFCACGDLIVFAPDAPRTECFACARRRRDREATAARRQAKSRKVCRDCGTRLLRVVPTDLCGFCDPEWILDLDADADRQAA